MLRILFIKNNYKELHYRKVRTRQDAKLIRD